MRSVGFVLVFLTAACAVWATVAAVRITDWVSRHGVKVNWFLWRLFLPGYIHRYQTMTREMEGQTGPLFAHFVVPISLALLFAVAALVAFGASR
jgi:hypothetical protein